MVLSKTQLKTAKNLGEELEKEINNREVYKRWKDEKQEEAKQYLEKNGIESFLKKYEPDFSLTDTNDFAGWFFIEPYREGYNETVLVSDAELVQEVVKKEREKKIKEKENLSWVKDPLDKIKEELWLRSM